jgi:hypothetical protein
MIPYTDRGNTATLGREERSMTLRILIVASPHPSLYLVDQASIH